MTDYTTSLAALARRAMDAVIDSVAKDGLVALRRVLDESGFASSEELKGYEVTAHVSGDVIEFEILVPASAVERTPEVDQMIREAREREEAEAEANLRKAVARSYGLDMGRPVRLGARDARRPARDARRPAKDARLTAKGRLLRHEISLRAPRSLSVNRDGMLSLRFQRAVRETSRGVEYPKRGFEGVMDKLTKELQAVIARHFVPELEAIIARTLA